MDYKVRWESLEHGFAVSDWCNKRCASRKFNKLKNERVLDTVWAELVGSPSDEEVDNGMYEDMEYVLDDFERTVVNILGKSLIIP